MTVLVDREVVRLLADIFLALDDCRIYKNNNKNSPLFNL